MKQYQIIIKFNASDDEYAQDVYYHLYDRMTTNDKDRSLVHMSLTPCVDLMVTHTNNDHEDDGN